MSRMETKHFADQRRICRTIVFNTALMRRRIRDPHLIIENDAGGRKYKGQIHGSLLYGGSSRSELLEKYINQSDTD